MRTRGGLGVVLDREGRDVKAFQSLDDVVVEADMGHPHPPVSRAVAGVVSDRIRRGGDLALQRGVHGKPVVMCRDLDLAGAPVQNRLVDTAVAVPELVGAEAECAAKKLVAEADAKIMLRPSCLGEDSTKPSSVTSSARRCSKR